MTTIAKQFPHYHKNVQGFDVVDVYRVLDLWGVRNHAIGHAVKKLVNAGQRGHKDVVVDLKQAIISIQRAIEMFEEDERQALIVDSNSQRVNHDSN